MKVLTVDGDTTIECQVVSGTSRMLVPVDLPTPPGGTVPPLSTLIVDPVTPGTGTQDGSVGQPYASVSQVLAGTPFGGAFFSAWQTGFTTDPVTAIVPDAKNFFLSGFLQCQDLQLGAGCNVSLSGSIVENIVATAAVDSSGSLQVYSAPEGIVGAGPGGTISVNAPAYQCAFENVSLGDTLLANGATLVSCVVANMVTSTVSGELNLQAGTEWVGGLHCGQLLAFDSIIITGDMVAACLMQGGALGFQASGVVTAGGTFTGTQIYGSFPITTWTLSSQTRFTGCVFEPPGGGGVGLTIVPAGFNVIFDEFSWVSFRTNGGIVTDLSKVTVQGAFAIHNVASDPVTLLANQWNLVNFPTALSQPSSTVTPQFTIPTDQGYAFAWTQTLANAGAIATNVWVIGTPPVGAQVLTADFTFAPTV
jgi:hypothetical protein